MERLPAGLQSWTTAEKVSPMIPTSWRSSRQTYLRCELSQHCSAKELLRSKSFSPVQAPFSNFGTLHRSRSIQRSFPRLHTWPESVLSANFTERIIWLAVLRSLKSSELSTELKVFLRRHALDRSDGQHPLLHAELAVAWLTGKLDVLDSTGVGRQLRGCWHLMVSLVRGCIRRRT